MDKHKGVVEGPMETLGLKVERDNVLVAERLAPYPNLLAVWEGRVSGHVEEWPMIRSELRRLALASVSFSAFGIPGPEPTTLSSKALTACSHGWTGFCAYCAGRNSVPSEGDSA